jgi:hypothetical protein
VVLSADLWRQQFSSDPSIVGRLLTVTTGKNVVAFEVIGVMPPDFRIPAGAQVWTALGPTLAADAGPGSQPESVRAMYAIGRLAPGATVKRAVLELSTIARNEDGLIESYWSTTENNRKAKYYRLTRRGSRALTNETRRWNAIAGAIAAILQEG